MPLVSSLQMRRPPPLYTPTLRGTRPQHWCLLSLSLQYELLAYSMTSISLAPTLDSLPDATFLFSDPNEKSYLSVGSYGANS